MKKSVLFILLALCSFLFTGCTKNYKTVSEFSEAMTQVKNNLGNYTIEAVLTTNGNNIYCNSFTKGNVWKTETSMNSDKNYQDGILYDGKDVYSYSKKQNIAMSIPFKEMLNKKGSNNDAQIEMAMNVMNPIGILIHWNSLDNNKNLDNIWTFGKKNEKKNNFACRMIHNVDGSKLCISDKYGIAVYAKIFNSKKGEDIEYNVKKISNDPISEYDLELPAGIKKVSMADMFRNLANTMK